MDNLEKNMKSHLKYGDTISITDQTSRKAILTILESLSVPIRIEVYSNTISHPHLFFDGSSICSLKSTKEEYCKVINSHEFIAKAMGAVSEPPIIVSNSVGYPVLIKVLDTGNFVSIEDTCDIPYHLLKEIYERATRKREKHKADLGTTNPQFKVEYVTDTGSPSDNDFIGIFDTLEEAKKAKDNYVEVYIRDIAVDYDDIDDYNIEVNRFTDCVVIEKVKSRIY